MTGCCIFIYSAAIAYLINNHEDKYRAQKAIDYALDLANGPYGNKVADGGNASAKIWIEDADKLWQECKAVDTYIHNPHIEKENK